MEISILRKRSMIVCGLFALLFMLIGGDSQALAQEPCCLPGGACMYVPTGQCQVMGGFIPPGGVCLGDTDGDGVDEACEMQQNQSCCMPGGACVMVPPTFCEQMGGIPLLGGACLGDINGNGMDDACEGQACCVPEDGSCYEELSYLCSQRGHVPKGLGTVCLGDNDKDGIDDICEPMELKFIQEPDTNRTGIDVMATNPNVLADDFLCTRRSLITHITVWGSWKNDILPGDPPDAGNVTFTLSIHEDRQIPDSVVPGRALWLHAFAPGSFTVSEVLAPSGFQWAEAWWEPFSGEYLSYLIPGDTRIFRYDFDIPADKAFCQQGGSTPQVYWLDVQAFPAGANAQFGWKTVVSPDSNFRAPAVAGQGSEPYEGSWMYLFYPDIKHVWYMQPIGLAFAISGEQSCPTTLFEYGDAPEGALAYPAGGVIGAFPTCVATGPAGFIQHNNFGANFGPMFDFEQEGNAGKCPLFDPNTYDQDECFQDNDAGLIMPPAYTIRGAVGQEAVVPCTSQTGSLGQVCTTAVWGQNVDIVVHNWMPNHPPYVIGYVNVLMDWDHNGQWGGGATCPVAVAPEHVLVNFVIPAQYDGPLSALGPPNFLIGPNAGYVWTRFTITEQPVPANWDGSGVFEDGETEDYLLLVSPQTPTEPDFGDAPDPTYPTLLASNGARHTIVPGFMLGNLIDGEPNGLQSPDAKGDDNNNVADEDGVVFNTAFFSGVPNSIRVTTTIPAGVNAYLNAWIDFDGNGSWGDVGEQIFTDQAVSSGVNKLTFTPGAITATGKTFARFRLSTQKGLSFTGLAPDGEVEDYEITIQPVKWLQRPDVTTFGVDVDNYWVQLADDFRCTGSGPITDIHLWTSFNGDILPPGGLTALTFTLAIYSDVPDPNPQDPADWSHPGTQLWSRTFNAGTYRAGLCMDNRPEWWFDPATNFWAFPGDTQIYQYDFTIPETEAFKQTIGTIYWLAVKYNEVDPGGCTMGWKTSLEHWNDDACWLDTTMPVPMWKELRYGGNHPMQPASIDLAFAITGKPVSEELDFGDAPDPKYPTLLASNGARHIIVPGLMLGNLIDSEPNGLPSSDAKGDDNNNLADEDGVTFNTALFSGVPNTITVTATIPPGTIAYLDAWIDFDGNGSWGDAGEQIFTDQVVSNGANSLTFTPGNITATGKTFARFRLSTQQGLSFTGLAPDGEVEDYEIKIAAVKWLQKPDLTTYGVDVDNYWVPLADDFRCTQTGPITDIHIWTSFADDQLPPGGLSSLRFKLFIYADVPDPDPTDPTNWSHPGELLWVQTFEPGQYRAGLCLAQRAEWWFDPATNIWRFPGDTQIYQYDFSIDPLKAFYQQRGTIYWLGLKYDEQLPGGCTLGWKSSLQHWNDDACWLDNTMPVPMWKELRYGGNHPMRPDSMDLAFAITTLGEEPAEQDFGDAPDPTYPTLRASNGARHAIVVPGLTLGALIDAEADGQPVPPGLGDDNNNLDDEDGVVFRRLPLKPGELACVDVTVSAAGFLNTWIDFNGNGVWDNPGEKVFNGLALAAGLNSLPFRVPLTAAPGSTYARFRFSSVQFLPEAGPAPDGEVEDYEIQIAPLPGILEVFPAANLVSSGGEGGPFNPPSKQYTLTNVGGQNLNWTAANTQAWVTLSSLGGVLAPGAFTTETVQINANANALLPGNYADLVTYANVTSGTVQTKAVDQNFSALPPDWQIFPDAVHKLPEGVVRLVASGFTAKAGSAFASNSLNSNDFEVAFDFSLANVSGTFLDKAGMRDPDGLTMVINGAPQGPGLSGYGIGYHGFPTDSFAVEFDCYQNSYDPDSNHVAIDVAGNVTNHLAVAGVVPDFDETGVWHAVVRYQAGSVSVTVIPPNGCPNLALSNVAIPNANIPLVKYVGFTSGAGGNSADVDIDNVVVTLFDQGGNRQVLLTVLDITPPRVTAAVSRKTHGAAGNFDIDLRAPIGVYDVAVECRSNGPTKFLFTFSEPVFGSGPGGTGQPADVKVVDTAGSAIVVSAVTIAGAVVTVDLSGVADVSRASITFPGIKDAAGNVAPGKECLAVLYGDATGDGRTNVFDLLAVKNQVNKAVTIANFRTDVTADGRINVFDLLAVKNNLNKVCPPPPCP